MSSAAGYLQTTQLVGHILSQLIEEMVNTLPVQPLRNETVGEPSAIPSTLAKDSPHEPFGRSLTRSE
jgi:hypothetical protein